VVDENEDGKHDFKLQGKSCEILATDTSPPMYFYRVN
jgi:hypothetical protein